LPILGSGVTRHLNNVRQRGVVVLFEADTICFPIHFCPAYKDSLDFTIFCAVLKKESEK